MAILIGVLLWWGSFGLLHGEVPAPTQLLVSRAATVTSTTGTLQRYERENAKAAWRPVGEPISVLFGWHGLAWGIGLHPYQPGRQKREGDGRSPMGRFAIGPILGEAPALPPGAKWTDYVQKTARTAWIGDSALPNYNHLYVLPEKETPPPWFESQQMRLHDPPRQWMIFIEHNYPDAQPRMGSAIFFHIRRTPTRPSAGCTTMSLESIESLLTWLDPVRHPQLVQLTEEDYQRLWREWDLPEPTAAKP